MSDPFVNGVLAGAPTARRQMKRIAELERKLAASNKRFAGEFTRIGVSMQVDETHEAEPMYLRNDRAEKAEAGLATERKYFDDLFEKMKLTPIRWWILLELGQTPDEARTALSQQAATVKLAFAALDRELKAAR